VLDAGKSAVALAASDSASVLLLVVSDVLTTGSLDSHNPVGFGAVSVASGMRNTVINSHF